MDRALSVFKLASGLARALPAPVTDGVARLLGASVALRPSERRTLVERNMRRADPSLSGLRLQRAVRRCFESYARYWAESFRLPDLDPEQLDAGMTYEGYDTLMDALDRGAGALLVIPHLGGWEWAGFWMTRVRDVEVSVVVERLEPESVFDWFVEYRESLGMHVIPLGPEAGRAVIRALKAGHVVCLLSDRDITGGGIEVEFFGERTTLPAGPATLALRTGAPLLPAAVYFRGHGHHGVVRPPLDTTRTGTLRDDVARVTQDVARALEDLIRAEPEQWHLMSPNWPSDHAAVRGSAPP
jgi:KDO2-lipid IV(A) lauroyltransferase